MPQSCYRSCDIGTGKSRGEDIERDSESDVANCGVSQDVFAPAGGGLAGRIGAPAAFTAFIEASMAAENNVSRTYTGLTLKID